MEWGQTCLARSACTALQLLQLQLDQAASPMAFEGKAGLRTLVFQPLAGHTALYRALSKAIATWEAGNAACLELQVGECLLVGLGWVFQVEHLQRVSSTR